LLCCSYPEPQFDAIVTLPESVELVTGEEGETVLFDERAKLFRFIDRQWKERGTGVMKILHNTAAAGGTGCARILMRRDHVYKVLCYPLEFFCVRWV